MPSKTTIDIRLVEKHLQRFGPLTTTQLLKAFPFKYRKTLTSRLQRCPKVKCVPTIGVEGFTWEYVG